MGNQTKPVPNMDQTEVVMTSSPLKSVNIGTEVNVPISTADMGMCAVVAEGAISVVHASKSEEQGSHTISN